MPPLDNSLLAVDLGVRTGLARYGGDGRLLWYRSQNFGSAARLRRAVGSLLSEPPPLTLLVTEGGGELARIWGREAERRGLPMLTVQAEQWRRDLLLPRQQRGGRDAKHYAELLARQVIAWSGARRPTSLRHDAAEAILVGLWAVLRQGWLSAAPSFLER